jgi:GntR family transcriptional regulator, transcriptional repressor for pyruvate dehydrogenase complex
MLENLQKITIEKPVDKIISQIRSLITTGELEPGDKLPPERKLAEHLGVGRAQVRDAIRKLEFYGILKTHPQSGTYVAGIGIVALEGLITDVLQVEESDFHSLVETRVILEKESARLAAIKRSADDIIQITTALKAYEHKITNGLSAVEEDLLFHIKIAEASKNAVLKSLMMIITPDIVSNFINFKVCDDGNNAKTLNEHEIILNHIIDQKPLEASKAMVKHLQDVVGFSDNMTPKEK